MDPGILLRAQNMPPATEGKAKRAEAGIDEGFHNTIFDFGFGIQFS